jgi:hypothetical protein
MVAADGQPDAQARADAFVAADHNAVAVKGRCQRTGDRGNDDNNGSSVRTDGNVLHGNLRRAIQL